MSVCPGACVAGLRASYPIAWLSACGAGLGLREGLKRCLRGMPWKRATSVHMAGRAYVVLRIRFARIGPTVEPI